MSCDGLLIVAGGAGGLLGVLAGMVFGRRFHARETYAPGEAFALPSGGAGAHLHAWELRSREQTSGQRIGVFSCAGCGELERRVLDAD